MLESFYVITAITEKGEEKFVGRDEQSGGYPYLSDSVIVFYNTHYFLLLKEEFATSLRIKRLQIRKFTSNFSVDEIITKDF